MHVSISDPKRYIPSYIAFSAIFAAVLFAMSYIGSHIGSFYKTEDMSAVINNTLPTVIIDAGHGGEDGGAVSKDGLFEKDVNLSIAIKLDKLLRECGVQTVLTRSEDILLYDKNSDYQGHKKEQDLAARRAIAEEYENAVFVSIHMNSFTQSKYSGLQVYYSQSNVDSARLANIIQTLTHDTLQPNNTRKTKAADSGIYLLYHLRCPAVLVECGFLSNTEEASLLANDEYRDKLALMLCSSITRYLNETQNFNVVGT